MASLGYGFYPTHPGEVLKDELEARGISQRKFADSIGMGYSVLNEILNGRRSDVPAESLMKLQLKYNMQTARTDKTLADKLKEIACADALL